MKTYSYRQLILHRMSNISHNTSRENQTTYMFNELFFVNRAICEKMSKNIVQPYRPQMTELYGRMHIASWVSISTGTHVISVLPYCFVFSSNQLPSRFHKSSAISRTSYTAEISTNLHNHFP